MADERIYPARPFLAVSAAIIHEGRVLIVRRGRAPARGIYTLPGGVVECGETLTAALLREVREETGMSIAPVALAGHREVIERDAQGRVHRHFVILSFAARWLEGQPLALDEISEAAWRSPEELAHLPTTKGLAEIVAQAMARLG